MYSDTYSTKGNTSVNYQLLPGHDSETQREAWEDQGRILKASRRQWRIFAFVELVIILVILWAAYFCTNPHGAPLSLANEAIQYETRVFHTGYPGDRTPYIGQPSPEVDALWEDLIYGGIFKITQEEEALLVNRTSHVHGDKDHFISSLGVVHHLHCLNKMRESLWPEYYPESDVRRNKHALMHQEHCIEILRQVHMCHPDTSAEVFQWDADQQKMIIPADRQHTCVNFKAVQQWMRKRTMYDDEFDKYTYVEGDHVYQPAQAHVTARTD